MYRVCTDQLECKYRYYGQHQQAPAEKF